jgi:probable F420-dependent oxidoreductase
MFTLTGKYGQPAGGYCRRVRFAICIPQLAADGDFDPAAFRTFLTRAEELGFDSAWTQEQVIGRRPAMDPLALMTYAAACTERLRLGCAVFVTPQHSPLHLAKSITSLDQLSHGRIEIGVGSGAGRPMDAFGVGSDGLIARFNEGLRLMKAAWTEPAFDFDGRFWRVEDGAMEPKPVQKPYPPLWFGGGHPDALRRAVRQGDGFFGAGSSPTARFAEQVQVLRTVLEEEGRDPAGFGVAKRVYVAVEDDGDRARERMAAELAALYGGRHLPDIAVAGTPGECAAGLREVADAGAELILLTAMYDEAGQMERLHAEVLPEI